MSLFLDTGLDLEVSRSHELTDFDLPRSLEVMETGDPSEEDAIEAFPGEVLD